jgi:hypothetical protein
MLFGISVLLPRLASARQADVTPQVSVGVGAGFANPFHGDLNFTAWAWEADVRLAMSRHLLLEVAVGDWRHDESFVRENIPVIPGEGVIGRFEQTTTRVQRSVQTAMLFTAARGRIRISAGGGAGFVEFSRRTRQLTSECTPPIQCGPFESSFSNFAIGAQIAGGAEARIVGGLAVYGQVRLVVPVSDPGGSDLRVTAGLRWGFGA